MKKVSCRLLFFILLCVFICVCDRTEAEEISEIKISGNRLIDQELILKEIETKIGDTLNKEKILEDLRKIYSLGFFDAKNLEVRPDKLNDSEKISLEFKIKENDPITDLIIIGDSQIDGIDAYDLFEDLIGRPENAKILSQRIHELEHRYLERGYILAKVTDLELDESGRLTIFVDEGKINNIVFKGNTKTKANFLKHLITNTNINEPYNEYAFAKDFKKIQSTGYFDNVTRSVIPNPELKSYDIQIDFIERKHNTTLGLGGGVNSSAGLFGNANMSTGNLRGQGETLNITALLGSGFGAGSGFNTNSNFVRRGNFNQINASYNIPYFKNSNYNLNPYLTLTKGPNFNVDISDQKSINLGATMGKGFGDHQRFSIGISGNYIDLKDRDRQKYIDEISKNIMKEDKVDKSTAKQEAKEIRDKQIISGFYTSIKPNYSYTDLDDPNKPREGSRANFSLIPTLGFGDVGSYTKFQGSTTRYFRLKENSSLLLNLRGGYRLAGTIPQFDKFRLGANTGVRGYRQFSELGLGDKLLISTAELRTPVYRIIPFTKNLKYSKYIDFASFADAGLIGANKRLNTLTDRLSSAASIGFGLRLRLPLVGALRIDLGFPLIQTIGAQEKKLFRINFGPADLF